LKSGVTSPCNQFYENIAQTMVVRHRQFAGLRLVQRMRWQQVADQQSCCCSYRQRCALAAYE